jgi:predicted SnoaL-like aldol condensation-catalyzing enzyme
MDEVFDDSYIQHSPRIEDGKEAVLNVFERRYERFPEYSIRIKRTAVQGDLVWSYIHAKRTPDSLGSAIIHVFRMKNGKFAEHWAVGQPVPETSRNDNGMF